MSKSFYVNGIEMKSTADGDNFDIDINKTTTTTLFPSGTDTKIKDETGNVAPNILGTNSHISLDKTDSCSDSSSTCQLLDSKITEVKLSTDKKLHITYTNMVGSTNPKANKPKADQLVKNAPLPFYDQMQPAWLICYTTLSGMNYVYQPDDWGEETNTSIIVSGGTTITIDITKLLLKNPIMLYVVANNGYKLSGIPSQVVNINGVITSTSELNDNRYYMCSDLPNGNEYRNGKIDPNVSGPDGLEGQLMVPQVDPTNANLPKKAVIPTLQFRNYKKLDGQNRQMKNRVSTTMQKELVDKSNPSIDSDKTSTTKYDDTSAIATCASSVVNYIIRELDNKNMPKSKQGNITSNIVIGGYLKLAYKKGYGNSFIWGATIVPTVMSDYSAMHEMSSDGTRKDNSINYSHYMIEKGSDGSFKLSLGDGITTDDLEYDERKDGQIFNRQPKLTVLGIGDNKVYGKETQVYQQVSVTQYDKLTTQYNVKYTDAGGTITKHVVMNINFIKVQYDFYGTGPLYALFEGIAVDTKDKTTSCINHSKTKTDCIGTIDHYQMYQNGTAWRIVRNSSNTQWELQKVDVSETVSYVSNKQAVPPPKNPTWKTIVTSGTTNNMVTPVSFVYTNNKTGSKYSSYTSTDWGKNSNIRIEQVGIVSEV